MSKYAFAIAASLLASQAGAAVLTFETTFANVSPGTPYQEAGFRLTPSNSQSATFNNGNFPPDSTGWFGFDGGNAITLTQINGQNFSLTTLLAGRSNLSSTSPISITLDGYNGATLVSSATFSGLTMATLVSPLFANVSSVVITSTDDAGLDDITVDAVPEPAMLALFGLGALGLGLSRRRRAA